MNIVDFFKLVHPSVLAAKMIFRHLKERYPVFKIADIADTTSGGTPNRGIHEYYNGDIPWVKSGELKDGMITTCDEYITEAGLKNSSAKVFPKGTLLVAMYGANIGKTGVLDFDAATNQAVCAIFPKVDISRAFLYWYFKQQRIDFIAVGKGGAQPNISQTIINNSSIVVPDNKVQDKIVKFLERIENCDGIDYDFFIPEVLKDVETIYKYKNSYVTLSDSFETQLTLLDSLNQAILQEAVQGKLVPQDSKDEPASELLKRITSEKLSNSGIHKTGLKARSMKPLSPIKPEEIPFEIPENWVWCRLGEIALHSEAGKSYHAEGNSAQLNEWGVIKTSAITSGRFIESENKRLPIQNENLEKIRIHKGDIIFCRASGSKGLAGKSCLVESEPDCKLILSDKSIRYIFSDFNLCLYIQIYNSTYFAKEYYSKLGTGKSTSMNNIVRDDFNKLPIPLPPLSEQKRIVAEIEKQFTKTKELKEHIIANQQATEQLLKALLHQAFEVKETEEV